MIIGIGTDIVENKRFEKSAFNRAFLKKCYSAEEIDICSKDCNIQFLAGNFAAKEAMAKALGTGFCGFLPRDITILRDACGKPFVKFSDSIIIVQNKTVHISISHSKDYSVAFALIEMR